MIPLKKVKFAFVTLLFAEALQSISAIVDENDVNYRNLSKTKNGW